MSVNTVQDTTTTTTETDYSGKNRNTGEMGKDQFLKLLVTQLKYQDPMKPVDDKEFISQMAQFSSLEQMQNLNTSFSAMRAFSLMGKEIAADFKDAETGEHQFVSGVVEKVRMEKGKVFVQVGEREVPIDDITEVSQKNFTNLTDLMPLIGKEVNGTLVQDNGAIIEVKGSVGSIKKLGNLDVVLLNGVELSKVDVELPEGVIEYKEDYLLRNVDKEVTVIAKDGLGREISVTGILKEVTENEGQFDVKLDEVWVPVDNLGGIAQDTQ